MSQAHPEREAKGAEIEVGSVHCPPPGRPIRRSVGNAELAERGDNPPVFRITDLGTNFGAALSVEGFPEQNRCRPSGRGAPPRTPPARDLLDHSSVRERSRRNQNGGRES